MIYDFWVAHVKRVRRPLAPDQKYRSTPRVQKPLAAQLGPAIPSFAENPTSLAVAEHSGAQRQSFQVPGKNKTQRLLLKHLNADAVARRLSDR